jgi:hypothetical protein
MLDLKDESTRSAKVSLKDFYVITTVIVKKAYVGIKNLEFDQLQTCRCCSLMFPDLKKVLMWALKRR